MKKKFKINLLIRVLSLVGIELIVAFVCSIAAGFIFFKVPEAVLLSPIVYKLQCGLLVFIRFLPGILITGIVIGFSWAFGKERNSANQRFSPVIADYLKVLMLISLICTVLCFVFIEIVRPSIQNAQDIAKEDSKTISKYMALAEEKYEMKDYNTASFYAKSAIELSPKYRPALLLLSKIENEITKSKINENNSENKNFEKIEKYKTDSIPNLINTARLCMKKGDYINAHFYASLVMEIDKTMDSNKIEAIQIASDAWNRLSETKSFDNELSKEVYESKKLGYNYLYRGEYSKAYYIFSELLEKYPLDYDIKKYYEYSKERLLTKSFFIDETANLQQFERFRNINFSLDRIDGGKDIIAISGITSIKSTERMVMYLREFSVISLDSDNKLICKMSVPYAKMCSISLKDTDENFQNFMNLNYNTDTVPCIYLKSLDRNNRNIFIEPEYTFYQDIKPEFSTIYIMPVSFETFSTLCDVSHGPETMNLSSLMSIMGKASRYGYSTEVLSQKFISRISLPFLLLIVFLIAGTIGWYTRLLVNESFRLTWLLLFPFITLISHAAFIAIKYLIELVLYAFLGMVGEYAIYVSVGALTLILFLVIVRFAAIRR